MCTCVHVMCVCICISMSLCARLSLVSVCGGGIRDLATHVVCFVTSHLHL